MFTIQLTDGPGPPQAPDKVNVLLVGSQASDIAEIRRELAAVGDFAYTIYDCADPEEALAFIRRKHVRISIIFLDLSHANARYPREYFLQLRQNVPDVPVIVLIDREDTGLQHFVMEEGAADNVSQWQLRSDPGRLRNIVKSCISRDKITRRERGQNTEDIGIARRQGDAALGAERGRSDAAMKKSAQTSEASLQDAHDVNTRLRGDIAKAGEDLEESRDRAVCDLRDAQAKGAADLRAAREWSEAALLKTHENHAVNLETVTEENEALRQDRDRSEAALKETQTQAENDLQQAYAKSDAILKYAQDKGALDLKKLAEENKDLRRENDDARSALSGGYSIRRSGSSPATSANENKDQDKKD